jgi:hypothetical protein
VEEIYERVRGLTSMYAELLAESHHHGADPQCSFGQDAALVNFKTYDVVRNCMMTGILNLRTAMEISQQEKTATLGIHLMPLRSSILATSRGMWILEPWDPEARVARAAGVVIGDRRRGRAAMQHAGDAIDIGSGVFASVAKKFSDAADEVRDSAAGAGIVPLRCPGDRELVTLLGDAVSQYYGTGGQDRLDANLLWNASSSISHGERWFTDLGQPVAKIVTARSLEVVCSGVNLLYHRFLAGIAINGHVSRGRPAP